MAFVRDRGISDLSDVKLSDLRSWLAHQSENGAARSTIARRAASARAFLRWASRTGVIAEDPSLRLVAPKRLQTLPGVLKQDEVSALLDVAAVAADDEDALHLRDRAMLELLYATGIRVGELVGLDIDDVDFGSNVVRVMGKGAKERTVPFGGPAANALQGWLAAGPGPGGGGRQWSGIVPGPTRRPGRPAPGPRRGPPAAAARARAHRTWGRTGSGTARPLTCSRAAPTFGRSRRCSVTPAWPPPRSTRTSRLSG